MEEIKEGTQFIPKYFPDMSWTGNDWDEWKSVIQDRYNHRLVILRSSSCINSTTVTMLGDIARDSILTTTTPIVYPQKTVYERYVHQGESTDMSSLVVYHVPSGRILVYYVFPGKRNIIHSGDSFNCSIRHPIMDIAP